MTLAEFLAENGALPYSWGATNCCLGPADWIVANGHADPAAAYRTHCESEAACRALIEGAGGVLPLFGNAVEQVGLTAIEAPVAGAVGVIGSGSNIHRQWAALFDGARWQVRLQSGWVAFTAHTLGIWGI